MTGTIARIVEGGYEGVGVERLVGDNRAGSDGFDEPLSASQIGILAWAEHHSTGLPRASTST